MKSKFLSVATVFLIFATSSSLLRAEEILAKPVNEQPVSKVKTFKSGVEYELIGSYDIARLNTILTTEMRDFTTFRVRYKKASNPVKLYRVTYSSVIPELDNKPITAYGLIAIPDTGKGSMPVVSYQHGTVYHKNEVPSFPENSMETRLMIAQFAGQGYVVIAADFFGMGMSNEKQAFAVKASSQQACLDMYYSALTVLDSEKIQMTDFFIAGWSMGGFATMAFLEKLESLGIPVRAAGTASAPCDAFVIANTFLNFPQKNAATWVTTILPLICFSFEEYYGKPGLAEALFNPDQYEIVRKLYMDEPFDPKDFPTDMHVLVRPEFFNPQYLADSEFGALLKKEAQSYRWVVQTPVRNYYGGDDEVITVGLGMLPMHYQQSIGNTKVKALLAGRTANHRGTFAKAVAKEKQWFDSLLTD